VLPPTTLAGVVGEAVSSLTTILVGWYAWRGPATRVGRRPARMSSHPLEGAPR